MCRKLLPVGRGVGKDLPTRKREGNAMPENDSYDSRDVAAYIAQQCRAQNIPYNNTKLQKLLYCAYGILLAWNGERICDEYPRAWQFGPVFPKVFSYFHKHGDISDYSDKVSTGENDDVRAAISSAIKAFGKYPANQLSAWTHKAGSPWDRAVNGDEVNEGAGLNRLIPDEFISNYFIDKVLSHG